MPSWALHARVVAVGLPGVAGVRQVGRFHFGGAIPANPEFLMHTLPGRVLDPERVLVAVTDNLGAPLAVADHAPGAVLSIDTSTAHTLVVPPDLAVRATANPGPIQLYTAQSRSFSNARHNAGTRTAKLTAASGPRYLSINNAFGRPWIANAPLGPLGFGSLSVVDPNGAPLANPPSESAGGVFAGHLTPRETAPRAVRTGLVADWTNHRKSAQFTSGALATGAMGTAFLGASPDGSGFAVFAAATADGAVVQAHVRGGVDGLAPPGTLAAAGPGDNHDPGVIGMAFKWNPLPALYLTDAARNRLVVLHLAHDNRHFTVRSTQPIASRWFADPADLAPAVPEVANPGFASHTTLAGGSDLYVANRGDGSLLRIDETGRVRARAQIVLPGEGLLGGGRIRAIAVSADAQRIWITLSGSAPGHARLEGALIEVPAFDPAGPFATQHAQGARAQDAPDHSGARPATTAAASSEAALIREGAAMFAREFDAASGLGPFFNARSCLACHSQPSTGGMSSNDAHFAVRIARLDSRSGRVMPIDHVNSPVARRFVQRNDGDPQAEFAQLPRQANVVSLRMPPALYGVARLDEIPDEVIEAQAVAKGDGIKGRVNRVRGADAALRVGRYGWKAQISTLEHMVADAFATELGIVSSALGPTAAQHTAPTEDDGRLVRAVTAFLRSLRPPAPAMAARSEP